MDKATSQPPVNGKPLVDILNPSIAWYKNDLGGFKLRMDFPSQATLPIPGHTFYPRPHFPSQTTLPIPGHAVFARSSFPCSHRTNPAVPRSTRASNSDSGWAPCLNSKWLRCLNVTSMRKIASDRMD